MAHLGPRFRRRFRLHHQQSTVVLFRDGAPHRSCIDEWNSEQLARCIEPFLGPCLYRIHKACPTALSEES